MKSLYGDRPHRQWAALSRIVPQGPTGTGEPWRVVYSQPTRPHALSLAAGLCGGEEGADL
jgi:hypothetical protein